VHWSDWTQVAHRLSVGAILVSLTNVAAVWKIIDDVGLPVDFDHRVRIKLIKSCQTKSRKWVCTIKIWSLVMRPDVFYGKFLLCWTCASYEIQVYYAKPT